MKLDPFAQVKFEGAGVNLLPAFSKLAFVLIGDWVAIDQGIPDIGGDDHANSDVIEVWINIFRRLVVSHPQGVVCFVGKAWGA